MHKANVIGYYTYNLLFAIFAVACAAYLVSLRINRMSIMQKHKSGTAGYERYAKLLNPRLLVLSILIAIGAIADVVRGALGANRANVYVSVFMLIVIVASLVMVLLVLRDWVRTGE